MLLLSQSCSKEGFTTSAVGLPVHAGVEEVVSDGVDAVVEAFEDVENEMDAVEDVEFEMSLVELV